MEYMTVEAADISIDLLLLDEPPFGVSSCDLRHREPAACLRADGSDVAERMWPLPLGPVRNVSAPPFSKKKKTSQPDALLQLAVDPRLENTAQGSPLLHIRKKTSQEYIVEKRLCKVLQVL